MIRGHQKTTAFLNPFWLILFVVMGLLLSACLPEAKDQSGTNDVEIVKVTLGNNHLYVPKQYFDRSGAILDTSILLSVMQPDFSPILEEPNKLWKKGEWYKNISILVQQRPKPRPIDIFSRDTIETLKAYEIVGKEHGLLHLKQPEGHIQDFHDVWIDKDDGEIVSVITCSEKLIENDFPQCSHNIRFLSLSIRASYDKRLLNQGKNIRKNIIKLLESFNSSQAAEDYINLHL